MLHGAFRSDTWSGSARAATRAGSSNARIGFAAELAAVSSHFTSIAEIEDDDLGRRAEPDRQRRAPKPAGDDQVPAVFDLVPINITRAEARRHNRRIAKNANLAAVRVAGKRQRNAFRDLWKNIRLMRHQDHRRIIRHLLQRARKIIDAEVGDFAAAHEFVVFFVARPERPLIAKARKPERLAVFFSRMTLFS